MVSCGGLGLRTAIGAALPAFVASRIMCRLLVTAVIDHHSAVFGNVLAGTEEAMRDLPIPSLRHAWGISLYDADGDDEHPARASA